MRLHCSVVNLPVDLIKIGGRIVNMTSGQFQGMVGELAYATTKGAIDALTSTLSAEVAHLGITVNAINPDQLIQDG